ncbi:hypothetical protein ABPG72_002184 [Tetrahymena utriculariae]
MIKKQVIEYNPNKDALSQNAVGVNQYQNNQHIPTTYGTQYENPNKVYEVKEDYEDYEQIKKKQVDDQTKFNSKNPIEYQNELKVQQILEQKAIQQLQNLCGTWDQQIKKRILLELDIIPTQLLGFFKFLIFFTLIDLLWVTFSCLLMPSAGMHFIQSYITADIRLQMFIYWCSNILQWICLTIMFAKLTITVCRATIVSILLNLAWHILNFVFYYTSSASRQYKFSIASPVIYWVESFISLLILIMCIILYRKIDMFVKTNPDRALVLNKNMEEVIQEQYAANNQILPISQTNNQQQGSIVYEMSQKYLQVVEQSNYPQNTNYVVNPSQTKQNFPISHRSIQIQNANTQTIQIMRENQSRANISIKNETDTNLLNQTNGNILYNGLYSQQFLDQDRSLVIDEIPNEKTAVLSFFHSDWRTHYGDYAPDQKKRKIILPQMVKQLEDDLKQSRKLKMKGNAPQMYTYFDLHFVNQSPVKRNNDDSDQTRNQYTKSLISDRSRNLSPYRQNVDLQIQQIDKLSLNKQTSQNDQNYIMNKNSKDQSPSRISSTLNEKSSKYVYLQQSYVDHAQNQSQTQVLNASPLKSRGQSLSFYGESSLGFKQRSREASQQLNYFNQDTSPLQQMQHSVSVQGRSKAQTQNNFQQNQNNIVVSTEQNFRSKISKIPDSQIKNKEIEDQESEYFKTKAIVGDLLIDKKKRWGNSTINKQQNIKTFDKLSNL